MPEVFDSSIGSVLLIMNSHSGLSPCSWLGIFKVSVCIFTNTDDSCRFFIGLVNLFLYKINYLNFFVLK